MTTKNGQVVVQAESQWEAATAPEKVERLQEREREMREAAEDLLQVTLFPSPAAIAREMQNRSQYLRTRPLRSGQLGRREKEILAELDTLEAKARTLDVQWQMNAVTELGLAKETMQLGEAAFALRGRFADLLAALDEPWASRAGPEEPEKRQRELAAIEAFLERKKARAKKGVK